MKHIWVVTSWFPTSRNPLSSTFVKEQVEILNNYGKGQFRFSVIHILAAIDLPNNWFRGKKQINEEWCFGSPDIKVYQAQGLIFSHRIPGLARICERKLLWKVASRVIQERGMPDFIWAVTLSGAFKTIDLLKQFNLNVPFLLHEHSSPLVMHLRKQWQRVKYRDLYRHAFRTVVVADKQIQEFKIDDHKKNTIHTVSNPANELFFQSSIDRDNNTHQHLTIVSVGRLTGQKAPLRQIMAAKQLADEGKKFTWYWLGDGELRQEVEQAILEFGLENCFIIKGATQRIDLIRYLRDASTFVLSSLHENCPVALIEAQAMGLPCVVVKNGASESVLLPGNGIVVEPDETGINLAEGIQNIIDARIDRNAIRERAQDIYHPKKFYESMCSLFL